MRGVVDFGVIRVWTTSDSKLILQGRIERELCIEMDGLVEPQEIKSN